MRTKLPKTNPPKINTMMVGGKSNHPTGSNQAFDQCLVVAQACTPSVRDSGDHEHFVVHAQAEDDAKDEHRQNREAAVERPL
jgi:hypothetical protein